MRAKFIPFVLLFALALGFAAACTASLGAEGGGYGLEGEVVLGERGGAPVTLRAEAVYLERLHLTADYDATSGKSSAALSWDADALPYIEAVEGGFSCELKPGLFNTLGDTSRLGWLREVFEDARAEVPGGLSGKLADYTDRLPVSFESGGIYDLEGEPLTSFNLGAVLSTEAGERGFFARRPTKSAESFAFSSAYGEAVSDSVVAADGNMYLLLGLFNGIGQNLDAAGLPGGECGVFRIPCSVEGDTSGERWWAEGGYELRADIDAIENIHPITGRWQGARLFLSHDGGELLLLVARGGAVALEVIDIESGAVTDTLELFSKAECEALLARFESYGIRDRARLTDFLACGAGSEGEAFILDVSQRERPKGSHRMEDWDVFDGAYLAAVEKRPGGGRELRFKTCASGVDELTQFPYYKPDGALSYECRAEGVDGVSYADGKIWLSLRAQHFGAYYNTDENAPEPGAVYWLLLGLDEGGICYAERINGELKTDEHGRYPLGENTLRYHERIGF